MWYKVAGEGHLAPGLDWANVVGLAGADFVGLDLDLEAPEAQGEGVTEITIGSIFKSMSSRCFNLHELKSYSGSYRFEPLTEIRINHFKKLA